MSNNVFGASGVSGAGFGMFAPEAPADPNQPAWVTSFQDTLKEIEDKGFRAYAKDMNDQKLAELRAKILEKMGLSEDDLQKMSPEGRASIEKMIAEEIRQRLASQAVMDAKDKKGDGSSQTETGADSTGALTLDGSSASEKEALAAEMQASANGLGPGLTLIRAMETLRAVQAAHEPENRQ